MKLHKLDSCFFLLGGSDVFSFLQGIITNDIVLLKEAKQLYSLILTSRGKFLADFFLYYIDDKNILIESSNKHKSVLVDTICLYNLHKEIAIQEKKYNSYVSFQKPQASFEYCFLDIRCKDMGWKVVTEQNLDKFVNDDAADDYVLKRIKNCIPDCSVDLVSQSSFPMEYNLDCAFSYKKGCYVGQEVTSRFKLRNLLKRKMFAVKISYSSVKIGDIAYCNSIPVGKFLSSIKNYALVLLDLDKIPSNLNLDKKLLDLQLQAQPHFIN